MLARSAAQGALIRSDGDGWTGKATLAVLFMRSEIRESADRSSGQETARCKREIKAIYNVSSDGIVYTRYYWLPSSQPLAPRPNPLIFLISPHFLRLNTPLSVFLQPFHRISPPSYSHTLILAFAYTCLSVETDPYFRDGSKIHCGEVCVGAGGTYVGPSRGSGPVSSITKSIGIFKWLYLFRRATAPPPPPSLLPRRWDPIYFIRYPSRSNATRFIRYNYYCHRFALIKCAAFLVFLMARVLFASLLSYHSPPYLSS